MRLRQRRRALGSGHCTAHFAQVMIAGGDIAQHLNAANALEPRLGGGVEQLQRRLAGLHRLAHPRQADQA